MTYDPFLDAPRPIPDPSAYGWRACALIFFGGAIGAGVAVFAGVTLADRLVRKVLGS